MNPNSNKNQKRLIYGIAIAVGVTLVSSILATWNPLEKWQLKMTNRLYDRNEPSQQIVIAAIDEQSVDDEIGLGRFNDWSILYYNDAIENLEAAGAAVIGTDIFFAEKSRGISEDSLKTMGGSNLALTDYVLETVKYLDDTHPEDAMFAETLSQSENIVLGEKFIVEGLNQINSIPNLDIYEGSPATTYLYKDADEVIRRIPLSVQDTRLDQSVKPFSVQIAEKYAEQNDNIIIDTSGDEFMINFAAAPYQFKMIPFADVYNGFVTEEDVEEKIVLIGAVTERIQDHLITPMSPDTPMPGVEVHANAIQTLLEGNALVEQGLGSQLATIAVLAILMTFMIMYLGILPGVGAALALILLYHFQAKSVFDNGTVLNLVYPTIALFLAYLSTTLYKYLVESRDKLKLKGAFSKYVNKDLVGKILQDPEALKLGGSTREITTFFSDIASFTSFSENNTAEAVVAQLNEYFEVMVGIIMKNGGTLNKFEGDAIMAFWGAPLDQPDHALLAAKSTLECRAALADLHKRWEREGKPLLNFRVGLSSGEAIAGNVGSADRLEYTVMGDIVNLGARLEAANKVYGTHVMISGATQAKLGGNFELRRLDRLRVKGKEQPVDVYELIAIGGTLQDSQKKVIDVFHQAMEYYRNGKFAEAETRFQEVAKAWPKDGPTQTYLKRCAELKNNPPEGWDGTWTLTSK
jgi:adenylate cyclase